MRVSRGEQINVHVYGLHVCKSKRQLTNLLISQSRPPTPTRHPGSYHREAKIKYARCAFGKFESVAVRESRSGEFSLFGKAWSEALVELCPQDDIMNTGLCEEGGIVSER